MKDNKPKLITKYDNFLSNLDEMRTINNLEDSMFDVSTVVKCSLPLKGVAFKFRQGEHEYDKLIVGCKQHLGFQIMHIKLYDEYNEIVVSATVYDSASGTFEDAIFTILTASGHTMFAEGLRSYYESHHKPVPIDLIHQDQENSLDISSALDTAKGDAFIEKHSLNYMNEVDNPVGFYDISIPLHDIKLDSDVVMLGLKSNSEGTITTYDVMYDRYIVFTHHNNLLRQFDTMHNLLLNEIYHPSSNHCDHVTDAAHYSTQLVAIKEDLRVLCIENYLNS